MTSSLSAAEKHIGRISDRSSNKQCERPPYAPPQQVVTNMHTAPTPYWYQNVDIYRCRCERHCCLHLITENITIKIHACYVQPLKSHHWLKVQERMEYKIISTTYKVLQSSSPHYLRDIITIQPSRSTRSSSLVTLLHPQAQSSLKITNGSLWRWKYWSVRQIKPAPLAFGCTLIYLLTYLAISDIHSTDSGRSLASSWTLLSQTLWGRRGGLLQLAIAFLPS